MGESQPVEYLRKEFRFGDGDYVKDNNRERERIKNQDETQVTLINSP